jgi:3-deoxy-manno-octulosonate cytidylyltransferase (CMP-KDO synthetase)
MNVCGVIPVRLDSKRFPGKALAKFRGKEIILHVWERARQYEGFVRLLVATDNQQIKDLIEAAGGEVYFSNDRFRNGSERVAAAAAGLDCDICVNVQGDEVFITPKALDATVRLLTARTEFQVTTAVFPLGNTIDAADPNLVKAVLTGDGEVSRFSRQVITDDGNTADPENFGHVGIYAFRHDFLLRYPGLEQTDSEREQSLEQLRILDHGYRIGAVVLEEPLLAINTAADLERAETATATTGGKS